MSLFLFFSLGQRSVLAPPLPKGKSRVSSAGFEIKKSQSWSSFPRSQDFPRRELQDRATQLHGFNRYTPGELTHGGAFLVQLSLSPRLFGFVRGEADSVKEVRGPDPLPCFLRGNPTSVPNALGTILSRVARRT